MGIVLKPTRDAVFKMIFGSSADTDELKSLIESVLEKKIEQLEILNPHVDLQTVGQKESIFDIKARALFQGERETYNIEIQVQHQDFFHNRSLFYWAQAYGGQLGTSTSYVRLRKHICINFLDFRLLEHGKLVSKYVIMEEVEKTQLTDHLELYFVQMRSSAYNERERVEDGTMLEKWVYFLRYGHQLNEREARRLDPSIEEAYKRWKEIKIEPHVLVSMIMKEKDDLYKIVMARRQVWVDQILEFAKDAGLPVQEDFERSLRMKEEDDLKDFVKSFYSDKWDRDVLKLELEAFLKRK